MDKLLNRCPKCGGTLEFSNLMQYSNVYKVTKRGGLSAKKNKKRRLRTYGMWIFFMY